MGTDMGTWIGPRDPWTGEPVLSSALEAAWEALASVEAEWLAREATATAAPEVEA